jgi:3-hydroxyisobutyrate dehydrogenase-like beta-hydroxyacid dehydrogenase
MMTVAVVGCGRMGSAMARRLSRAGFELVLWNRTPERARELAAATGGRAMDSAAEAVAAADVTITMLADDVAVRSTFTGPGGLVEGAGPGRVLVDMSTVLPGTILSVEDAVRGTGAGLLDAPVSGSTVLAEDGALTVMVGGQAADLELARPALEALARRIFHLGPLSTGAAMKLAVNTLIFGLNGAVAEGLVLAEAAGIDRTLAYDVIAASAAGAPLVAYKREAFVSPETAPVAFSLDLAEKDLRLITAFAASLGIQMPQAETNLELVRAASTDGRGSRDFATGASELRARRALAGGVPTAGHERPGEAPLD